MKRIVILFLLFLNLFLPAAAKDKDINFIQVTDVHLTKNNAHYLEDFVEEINQKYNDLDFVVFTGDNVDHADPAELDLFLKIIKNIKFQTYVIPGNHDLYKSHNMTGAYYMQTVRKALGSHIGKTPNYVFKKGNIIFMTMNGVKEVIPSPNGYYRQDELVWLDKQLNKYKNKKVVILQHFPVIDSKQKSANTYKKDDYLEVLNKHNNVIAIISGHFHYNYEEKIGDVYYIVTQKFMNFHSYKLITISGDDDFIYTQLQDKNEVTEE